MWSDFTGLWIPKLAQGLHWALLSTSPLTGSCFGSCLFSCFRHRATRHGTWLHSQVHTQFQLFLQPAPLPPLVIYLLPIQWILLSCDTTQAPHFFQTSDGYLDSFLAAARSSYPTLLLGIITVWPCHTQFPWGGNCFSCSRAWILFQHLLIRIIILKNEPIKVCQKT